MPNFVLFTAIQAWALNLLEGTPMDSVISALTSAMTTIKTDFFTALGGILPVALAIVGAGMVIVLGIKMFKKISSKAG